MTRSFFNVQFTFLPMLCPICPSCFTWKYITMRKLDTLEMLFHLNSKVANIKRKIYKEAYNNTWAERLLKDQRYVRGHTWICLCAHWKYSLSKMLAQLSSVPTFEINMPLKLYIPKMTSGGSKTHIIPF